MRGSDAAALASRGKSNPNKGPTAIMTDNYFIGGVGYYMPSESFRYLRKVERMIEKITPPTPINLLDHIIIPINVRHSHWFPAHINLHNQSFSFLDSYQEYSVTSYPPLPTTGIAHLEIP